MPVSGLNGNYMDVEYCGLSDMAVAGDVPARRHIAVTLDTGKKHYMRVLRATRQNDAERLYLENNLIFTLCLR
ncbi:hypothetical protein LU604_16945 [Erwinia tracheiphila]|uniref:Uncharacterized protein n=1 Tax=Erwinia tracheiphila TaxID=65700 RepID=A0A345CP27_9GAMM|nr:hypothetical protein [Erwinia tracheiphila]AXF75194.1 hypothetical protein AV903_02230 [Erwinia tracheiphila]UIA82260.1 hypothetical protein LU604_16945 [Erwinia tracheiphila]UIA90857.1 hypothetical protein LU632_16535 [Erwinia tracheiphila]